MPCRQQQHVAPIGCMRERLIRDQREPAHRPTSPRKAASGQSHKPLTRHCRRYPLTRRRCRSRRLGEQRPALQSRTLPVVRCNPVEPRSRIHVRRKKTSSSLLLSHAATIAMCAPAPATAHAPRGEVAEWLNAPHSKCGMGASPSGVRIPPSPPVQPVVQLLLLFFLKAFGVLPNSPYILPGFKWIHIVA